MRKILLFVAATLVATHAQAAVVWTYDGQKNGQEDWGTLAPEYGKCSIGSQQSPVSVSVTKLEKLPALQFVYPSGKAQFSLDRYSVVAQAGKSGKLTEGTNTATLKEMLVRSPSEHDIQGKFTPLELQLTHALADGKLVIVSVFVTEGRSNLALQTLIDHFPKAVNDKPSATLDWQLLLPGTFDYYAYSGSLSTPPCTEGVEWRILKTPIEASKDQIRAISQKLGRNARLPQPLLMRTVRESE